MGALVSMAKPIMAMTSPTVLPLKKIADKIIAMTKIIANIMVLKSQAIF